MAGESRALGVSRDNQIPIYHAPGHVHQRPRGRHIGDEIARRIAGDGIDGGREVRREVLGRQDHSTAVGGRFHCQEAGRAGSDEE